MEKINNNELYHYGILGMKWGVRRYQPYGNGGYNPKTKKRYGKNLTKVALVVGAAALTYTAIKNGYLDDTINFGKEYLSKSSIIMKTSTKDLHGGDAGKEFVGAVLKNTGDDQEISQIYDKKRVSDIQNKIKEATGVELKTKDHPGTLRENVQTNPNCLDRSRKNNCSHASVAFILNEQGFDVDALPMSSEFIRGGMTPSEYRRFWKGMKWSEGVSISPSKSASGYQTQIANEILKVTGGDRKAAGVIRYKDTEYGGHYINFKTMKNGKIKLVDSSRNSTNPSIYRRLVQNKIDLSEGIDIARLDNLEPNPRYILTAVRSKPSRK